MSMSLTPSVASPFGSTPGMVLPRSEPTDIQLHIEEGQAGAPKGMFQATKTSDGWKIGSGWIYCGLTLVTVEEATIPASSSQVYLNVKFAGTSFSASISQTKDNDAVVSIVLYEFSAGKIKTDGRNVMFIPLYN